MKTATKSPRSPAVLEVVAERLVVGVEDRAVLFWRHRPDLDTLGHRHGGRILDVAVDHRERVANDL